MTITINPIALGFILGVIVTLIIIIILSIKFSKKKK